MSTSPRRSMASTRGSRKAARRRRERGLKLESLEPRLALATGLLSTLVSVVRGDNGHGLLAPGATAEVTEGTDLAASVRLTRRPDSAITVTFQSLTPLEVGVPSTPLRFTPANWNQPQSVSFASLQDGSRDGDQFVPVSMTAAVARNPQAHSSKKIWIESLDSGVITPASPATDTYKGSIVGGSGGGVITGTYDGVLERGTLSLNVTLPQLVNFRNRTITVDYSVGADNRVQVERVVGVAASQFRLDATYRHFGADRGLFGTFTVLQPQLGRSATATLTAAAVPEAVQNLAVAATGVGTLLLSWTPPADGATSYTVSMNAISINRDSSTTSSTTTSSTTATSMSFTGLSATSQYTFTVTPNTAGGAGPLATTAFQAAALIQLGTNVQSSGITTGPDGSLWVANYGSSTIQQIVNVNGAWVAQSPIPVGLHPQMIAIATDGSIWVTLGGNVTYESVGLYTYVHVTGSGVQQIVNANGVWTAQPSIALGFTGPNGEVAPYAITAGLDGSVWVASGFSENNNSALRQIKNTSGTWTAQPPIALPQQAYALTTTSDGSIWASSIGQWGMETWKIFSPFLFTGPIGTIQVPSLAFGTTVQQISSVNGVWTPQSAITVGKLPFGLAPGTDGSVWVANNQSNSVQQVTNSNGTSTAQSAIAVGSGPTWLAARPDGIWVINEKSNTIQPIVRNGETGAAQSAISLIGTGKSAVGLTSGKDGSAWVTSYRTLPKTSGQTNTASFVQQVCIAPSAPQNLSATAGPAPGTTTLNWTAPPNNGSPIISYTATVFQGTTSQTITTTSPSCTFSGLAAGQSTYFTVTATTFVGTSPAGSLLLGADGNPVDIGNKVVGIAADGVAFSGGGFDGNGYAYSWEALGSSPTLAWNGVNFQLGGPGQPDCVPGLGQTIAVPQGAYTQLNLAGAAVNGSQQNQQIKLTFTDGSTVTWTQSFSDWCSPQKYGHEAIIATQNYRDTASGGAQQFTNNVYGYSYTIPSGKTLASITLPNNQNVRLLDLQMTNSTAVNLSSSYKYNSWGIANGSTQVANHQGFDGSGNYYYSGNLQSTIAWSGVTFSFGPVPNSSSGQSNVVKGTGQQIAMPNTPFNWLYLAGAGSNGNQGSQQLKLLFSDGSTAIWTQSFSDWCSPQNNAGETIIQVQPQRVNQVGNVVSLTNYVYGYAYKVPAGKTLVSVTLPNNSNLGILGMTVQ